MSIIETMIDIPMEHERNVCGQFDAYLKKIERTLHVTMITRDGALKIIGPEQTIRQAKSVFNNLLELSKRGNTITEQNVDYALSLSFTGRTIRFSRSIRISSAGRSRASRSNRRRWDRNSTWI